jgi:hypothetical protein
MFVDLYCLTCLKIFGMFDDFSSREDLEELLLKSGLKYLLYIYMDMYEFMCNFSYFLVCDQCQPTSFKKTHDVTWTRFSPAHLGLPNLRTLRSKSGLHLQNCQMALGLSENRGDLQMAIGHYHRENGHEHEVQFGFGGT